LDWKAFIGEPGNTGAAVDRSVTSEQDLCTKGASLSDLRL